MAIDAALLDLTPAPAAGIATVPVRDEAMVVDEVRGHLHLLNPSGALVWQLLDGVSTLDEICIDLADVLEIPFPSVVADVTSLAQRLLDDGLVVAAGYTRPPLADEFEECDCGARHGPDDVDHIEIRGNP